MKVNIGKPNKDGKRHEKIVIEDHDIWNLDVTFAMIIAPALKKIRNSPMFGIPSEYATMVDGAKIYTEEFDHMISCFERYVDHFELAGEIQDRYYMDDDEDRIKELWKEIDDMYADFQRGFDFFAKNYMNFWT
jgi:hypothetical protein